MFVHLVEFSCPLNSCGVRFSKLCLPKGILVAEEILIKDQQDGLQSGGKLTSLQEDTDKLPAPHQNGVKIPLARQKTVNACGKNSRQISDDLTDDTDSSADLSEYSDQVDIMIYFQRINIEWISLCKKTYIVHSP